MIAYREQIASALRAVAVASSSSYSWFGRRSRPLPTEVISSASPHAVREYLTEALERELYRSFYTQGKPVPWVRRGAAGRPDLAFVAALSFANAGAGGWAEGWRVVSVERGIVVVEKDGLRVRAQASDCRTADELCTPGAQVSVRRPKELTASSPGYYTALGDLVPVGEGIELRVYFNVSLAGAAPLVAACTRLLNEARIPFSLKVANQGMGFARCDAAVLYLDDCDSGRVRPSLPALASACGVHLRGDPPAFARPLFPGVSVGEHLPGLGASFGATRCRLVAEGIVAAHEDGAHGLQDRVDAVARRFAWRGLDVDAPYLAPESSRRHELK
jgi:HopA1 effector protein family